MNSTNSMNTLNTFVKNLAKQDSELVIKSILYDLFSINELKRIEQRLDIARMLKQESDYRTIMMATGASSATIAKVSENIKYGNRGFTYLFS